MIRSLAPAFLVALFAIPTVEAAGFSSLRCEDPEVIAIMEEQISGVKAGGTQLSSQGVYLDEITASATHFSSANKLVCAISVRVSNSGSASAVRMFYTYEQFASGKKTATLSVR